MKKFTLVLWCATLLLGCGSRSALLALGSGASNSGGTGASGAMGGAGAVAGSGGGIAGSGGTGETGGAAGTAGVGGAGPDCFALSQVLPTETVEQPFEVIDENPVLVRSSDSGQQVSVVLSRQLAASSTRQLVHATFSPWASWPPSGILSPTFVTFSSPQLSAEFAAGQGDDGHFGALVEHTVPGGSFLSFAPFIDANAADSGPNLTLAGQTPGFVRRGPPGLHLVGTQQAGMLTAHLVSFDGSFFGETSIPLGCADSPIVADAVEYQNGFLVAFSNAANGVNGCGGVDPGPPTHIDVHFVANDGTSNLVTSIDAGGPVAQIAAAAHAFGMHLVYRVASGGVIQPIQWLRLDPMSGFVIGPKPVSSPSAAPTDGFAVAALGTKLAVAWGNDPADNPPDVVITVLDDTGAHLTETSFEPPFLSGSLAAIGSPDARSVVIGWPSQVVGGARQVELARFDCVVGL